MRMELNSITQFTVTLNQMWPQLPSWNPLALPWALALQCPNAQLS